LNLEAMGWSDERRRTFEEEAPPGTVPARIVRVDRGVAHVVTLDGEAAARWGGRLFRDEEDADPPVVGDWVALRPRATPEADPVVVALLPRTSRFARQSAGRTTAEQVLAANLDTLFVVCGLDGDFNLRRIERYLTLARAGGVEPVVVLNKADLSEEVDDRIEDVRKVAPGVAVVAIAARDGEGIDRLAGWLVPGATVALVGSSGAGKSTLLNRFLGEDRVRVRAVRESDDRGRHTTTRRELFVLPTGALCIDTPGLRELQLSVSADDVDAAFPDVEALAADCRFRDCGHDREPGCAVREAAKEGRLDAERLDSWRRLQKEAASQERRDDEREARAEARRVGRMYRRILNEKNDRRRR